MDAAAFITTYLEARKEVEDTVKQLYHLQKFGKQLQSGDKVVDLVRHLLWYEDQMLHVIQKRDLGDNPYWNLDHAERNQLIKDKYLIQSDELIYTAFMNTGKHLSEEMQSIPIEDYLDPKAFAMPDDWEPFDIFSQNLVDHYHSHLDQLKRSIHDEID